jgi:hypothetical protein
MLIFNTEISVFNNRSQEILGSGLGTDFLVGLRSSANHCNTIRQAFGSEVFVEFVWGKIEGEVAGRT